MGLPFILRMVWRAAGPSDITNEARETYLVAVRRLRTKLAWASARWLASGSFSTTTSPWMAPACILHVYSYTPDLWQGGWRPFCCLVA